MRIILAQYVLRKPLDSELQIVRKIIIRIWLVYNFPFALIKCFELKNSNLIFALIIEKVKINLIISQTLGLQRNHLWARLPRYQK